MNTFRMARALSILWLTACGVCVPAMASENTPPEGPDLQHSVEQLRSVVGRWAVTTECLNPDGSIARSVEGTYEFDWVVPDRVVSGKSTLPELQQASGLLYYINENERKIEMVSVAADGRLWVMSGALS